jgi:hypothetical protein
MSDIMEECRKPQVMYGVMVERCSAGRLVLSVD